MPVAGQPNARWSLDFVSDSFGASRKFRILAVIDNCNREEAQMADPFIAAKMGGANTPAYRGTAYVVYEELPLSSYGNRLPQFSFEVFRSLAEPDTAEGLNRAVTMIPASGESTYVQGISTRSVDDLVKAMGMSGISKSQFSRLSVLLKSAGEGPTEVENSVSGGA